VEKMRRPQIRLIFDNKDITRDVINYLLEFSYDDYAHGKADNVEIKLEDIDGIWKSNWFPQKGLKMIPYIDYNGIKVKCGEFEIDEIEASSAADVITIKGISSFVSKSLRMQKNNKNWEHIGLKDIAGQIARKHDFSLFFDGDDVYFNKISQKNESDLHFLKRICEQTGMHIKVSERKIVVFEAKSYDEKKPLKTFVRGKSDILSFNLRTKSSDIYRGCVVQYFDEEKKKNVEYYYEIKDMHVGQILKINKRAHSLAEAERLAKCELRNKNQFEVEGSIETEGDISLFGGQNIALSGFGVFDGNYFIEEARHTISAKYTTTLNIRKVLCY